MNESLSYYYAQLEPVALEVAAAAAQLQPANPQAAYLVETARSIVDSGTYGSTARCDPSDEIRSTLAWFRLLCERLVPFVTGSLPAAKIIREGGGQLWAAFQAHEPFCAAYAHGVARAIRDRLGGKRVMELGAGTGGTTRRMLADLKTCDRFVLTDVRRSLLDRLAAELSEVPLQTAIVDINLMSDGMNGPFDVIVATNCIHVATDVRRTMRWLRSLLAPGGALVLGEGAHYSDDVPSPLSLVLALFDGWWDTPRCAWRPRPGFLSSQQWLEAFDAAGFDHVSAETWSDAQRAYGGVYWGFAQR